MRVEGEAAPWKGRGYFRQSTNGLFWTSMALQTHSLNALGTDGQPGDTVPSTVPLSCWKEPLGEDYSKTFHLAPGTNKAELPPKGWE